MEEELKCPLCLDFFKSPVRITNCGHNYCQGCLEVMTTVPWLCPECRTEQQQTPEQLARNFFLEKTVENFIASRKNICASHGLPKKLRKYFSLCKSRFRVSKLIFVFKTVWNMIEIFVSNAFMSECATVNQLIIVIPWIWLTSKLLSMIDWRN